MNAALNLTWSEAFSVGHDGLDDDHRRLIKAINDICEAYHARRPPSFVHSLLKALERETEKHLKHENAVMLAMCADGEWPVPGEAKAMAEKAVQDHIAEHERNFARLQAIMRAESPTAVCAASHLCMELRQWFVDHAVKYDSHLKAIFQAV